MASARPAQGASQAPYVGGLERLSSSRPKRQQLRGKLRYACADGLREETDVSAHALELRKAQQCIQYTEWMIGNEHHGSGARHDAFEARAVQFVGNPQRAQNTARPVGKSCGMGLRAEQGFALTQAGQAPR